MKFEPVNFIRLAHRNGIQLTRIGNHISAVDASPIWVKAIKKHKRQLLKHLPEDQIRRIQTDLFEDAPTL